MARSRSYVGAKVRLLRDITTNGGTRFRQGVIMKVLESYGRGGLSMVCYKRGHAMHLRGVNRYEVEVVEWRKKSEDEES